jgi:hypothetical protein
MEELLDRQVPRFDEPGDWDDVLRRARPRHRPSRRLLAIAVVLVAAFIVAPALAVLLRDRDLQLPSGADRSNVVVMLQPKTGRVLLMVAPWKGHDGFCYFAFFNRAGCVARSSQTVVTRPPVFGWTFDPRIRSGTATTLGGKQVRLTVRHFGGRVNATFFLVSNRLSLLRQVVLQDAGGHVIARIRR